MTLEPLFTKNGFRYQLIKRSENFAIYEQKNEEFNYKYYEVIKIKKSKRDYNAPWGLVPAGTESYPSSESWGVLGWTYFTLEQAERKFNQLVEEYEIQRKKDNKENL